MVGDEPRRRPSPEPASGLTSGLRGRRWRALGRRRSVARRETSLASCRRGSAHRVDVGAVNNPDDSVSAAPDDLRAGVGRLALKPQLDCVLAALVRPKTCHVDAPGSRARRGWWGVVDAGPSSRSSLTLDPIPWACQISTIGSSDFDDHCRRRPPRDDITPTRVPRRQIGRRADPPTSPSLACFLSSLPQPQY